MATKLDEKVQMRKDYEQLQREFKNMEAMRKAYSEESLGIIKRQREMCDKLQRDNDNIKAELDLETRYAQRKTVSNSTLNRLNDQVDMYTSKVEIEKKNLDQLTKQVRAMRSKIKKKREDIGGVNAAKEKQGVIHKQIRILENRLDKALVKFNEALAYNKELRRQIDNLRRERFMFDKIYKKLEEELREKKNQMATIIELSNQAYEARDGAQLEIAAIQQSMAKERGEFDEKMDQFNAIIQERTRAEQEEAETKRGNLTIQEEAELKTEVNKRAWAIAKDRAAMQVSIDKVQSYEEAFKKINAATGITDVAELVSTFIHNEDQNFSLFNYVSEQNNELERLEETIAGLQAEVAKHTQESGEDINQHKQLLNELEARLQATDAAAAKYELRFQEAQNTVSTLNKSIEDIFKNIGCDSSLMSEMLAELNVTENNMMQYLGVIEQRTNEILQAYARTQADSAAATGAGGGAGAGAHDGSTEANARLASILGQGPVHSHGGIALHIDPPKLDDYSSDEDDSDDDNEAAHPLSLKELKDRTMKVLEARPAANRSGRMAMDHGRRGRR